MVAKLENNIYIVLIMEVGEELADIFMFESWLYFYLSFELIISVRTLNLSLGDYFDGELSLWDFIEGFFHWSKPSMTNVLLKFEAVKS